MNEFLILFIFFPCIYSNSIDSAKLKTNYFKEKIGLYYTNSLIDDEGNLYFEFWGNNNNFRYFIGKRFDTEEQILFDNNKIFSINSNISSGNHESIIVNYNSSINIFSLDCKNISFINFNKGEISSLPTESIGEINDVRSCSLVNSLIKLKDNKYLLSFSIFSNRIMGIGYNYINLVIFNFTADNINGFNLIKSYKEENIFYDLLSTKKISIQTKCFETENSFIQCLFFYKEKSQFTIDIFGKNLSKLYSDDNFGSFNSSDFTKIFSLKGEIGVYIFFSYNLNEPLIFIEKLNNSNYYLYDLFEKESCKPHQSLILNANNKFVLDSCFSCLDAIKINNTQFVVILTIKNTNDLLICLFDLYNNDSSLRIRYFKLELSDANINILEYFKAFAFKNYFGSVFYDSNNKYPGYLFFNYPNITSNNKINFKTIEIKLFVNSSESYFFPLSDNIEIINNIYGGNEKIKILNYQKSDKSGIIVKSSKTQLEICSNIILDIDDALIFEQNSGGVIPGKYFLEFILLTDLSEVNNINYTEYYGNGQESYFDEIQYFNDETYKLIYEIECYEKCDTCSQLGSESFYYCVKCLGKNFHIINNGEKCICEDYIFINEKNEILCLKSCYKDQFQYHISDKEKYCLYVCEFNGREFHKDESSNSCNSKCLEDNNGNDILFEKICVKSCPKGFIPDKNGICTNTTCSKYFYLDEKTGNYECIKDEKCPNNYPFLKIQQKECSSHCTLEELDNNLCYLQINSTNEEEINTQDKILENIRYELTHNLDIKKIDKGGDIIYRNGKNIYTITSTKNQNDVLKNMSYNMNISIIDLTECQKKLIEKNKINEDEILYILKLDIGEENMKTPIVKYDIYYVPENETNLVLLDISECENTKIDIFFPLLISTKEIDKYNKSSSYYNDICNSDTTKKGIDITLKDRQKEFVKNNMDICREKCEFSKYNDNLGLATCSCLTKTQMGKISSIETKSYFDFKEIIDYANLDVIKCIKLILNKKELMKNIPNYIIIIIFLKSLVILFIFICRDYKKIKDLIDAIINAKKQKEKNENIQNKETSIKNKKKKNKSKRLSLNQNLGRNLINSNKETNTKYGTKSKINNHISKNINLDHLKNTKKVDISNLNSLNKKSQIDALLYNDMELNLLDYEEAIKYDERTYCQYYISLLRNKNILFFTFYKGNDYNIRTIKIYLFFFSFVINFSICIFFYNYDTMHKIYEEEGSFNFIYQLPQIIYSALITGFLTALVNKLGLCQNNILAIKKANLTNIKEVKNKEVNLIIIKFLFFFIINYILLFFFWIYSVSFCFVYKNTQIHLLKEGIISFSTNFFTPFLIYLIPGIFRILSLKRKKERKVYMYNFSKLLQMI